MQKWEYKSIVLHKNKLAFKDPQHIMNNLGEEGWELCGTIDPKGIGLGDTKVMLVFKRPVGNEDRVEKFNDMEYGEEDCICGHPYHRHFDPYEDWSPVGCKYCQCYTFKLPDGIYKEFVEIGNRKFKLGCSVHNIRPGDCVKLLDHTFRIVSSVKIDKKWNEILIVCDDGSEYGLFDIRCYGKLVE